jgi:hypothetical protein
VVEVLKGASSDHTAMLGTVIVASDGSLERFDWYSPEIISDRSP